MTFSRQKNPITYDYKIEDHTIQRAEYFKDLGVTFDNRLTFVPHINDVVRRSLNTLGFVHRSCREFTEIQPLITLFFALVRSKLEYCSIVWSPLYNVHITST